MRGSNAIKPSTVRKRPRAPFPEIEGKRSPLRNKQFNPIEAHRFWTHVWGIHVSYDEDAYWIEDVSASLGGSQMREP